MRIALAYDALYPDAKGGVEKRSWELATRLVAQGHEVHLLVPKSWAGDARSVRDGVILRGVCARRDLYTSSGRRAVSPAVAHALGVWKLLRRERFDVVDCQIPAYPAALAAWHATRRTRTNLIVTWHEAWDQDWTDEMGTLGLAGRGIERIVARIPALHLAVSQQTADTLAAIGGAADAVIPPGVDVSAVGSVSERLDEDCDILFAGRLVPTKNLGLLLDAVRLLVGDGLHPKVVVVGDGPARVQWEDHARRLGVEGQVEFRGAVETWEEVISTLRSAKVLALPSLREGFGMVALEAAACGVPVVTVDHRRNAARHVVQDGITGLCVHPDPESFAEGLKYLLEDEAFRDRLGRQASHEAAASDWEAVVAATQSLYVTGVA